MRSSESLSPRQEPERLVIDAAGRQFRIFIVAGEHSGDVLGAKLMAELNRRLHGRVRYLGVGGEDMERQGLVSQFPLADVAVMGLAAILARLPRLVSRVYATVASAVAAEPDLVIIVDSPEFTHPIAKRIRKRRPGVPIIDYVSPTVWAWRPGRARKMARYVDHILGLLPFEPAAHKRLGGPPCTYVGHPMIERAEWLAELPTAPLAERLGLDPERPVLVVLPGSRSTEVTRLMGPFGGAVSLLQERGLAPQVIIPAVSSVKPLVLEALKAWPVPAHVVEGEADKFAAFKLARGALAASGTVTLELAVAGAPMVVAYRVDGLAKHLRFLVKVPSIVLANLVLGENAFPELIQEDCTPEKLADAVELILKNTPERAKQLAALSRIGDRMKLPVGTPSQAAADVVMGYLAGRR